MTRQMHVLVGDVRRNCELHHSVDTDRRQVGGIVISVQSWSNLFGSADDAAIYFTTHPYQCLGWLAG